MGSDADDAAVQALIALKAGLERSVAELRVATERADQLIEQRRGGRSWYDMVASEEPPLVVETVTRVLEELGELGGRFRREEAFALQGERVSITRIGALFRVSRQRVSALLREHAASAR